MNTLGFTLIGMIGPWQIILIVVVLLIFFGGKKIPEMMKGLGQGMNEFKKAANAEKENKEDIKEEPKEKKE